MCPAEANKRRGKRQRMQSFFDNLRDMEEASRAVQQQGQEQHDRYMQMLLDSQGEEREMRRRELAFLEHQSKRRLESEHQANQHAK
ncbi:hypothetical protein AAFF_G00028990 [Aldrovandia affinis]|uniref:Uncharacterized protein n=1 Tax=Aldrovandia affinis TaxID=143900 RepID=A0AAD7S4L1_9TELE|nr:hypothetical protein AAFF_G00028990 [Aldrovandia affinis]